MGEEEALSDFNIIEVDRILSSTDLFPIIHPKKANELKGKWCEPLIIIINKLLNYTGMQNDLPFHYAIYFLSNEVQSIFNGNGETFIENSIDLLTIATKIYLGHYK